MAVEMEKKPRALRIVEGTVAELELELNALLEDYTALVWNFSPVGAEIRGVVVLISNSVVQRQQLAAAGRMGRIP